MCLINVRDLSAISLKTLIFFTYSDDIPLLIPNSYIFKVPSDLGLFINSLRRLDISFFPIICYDNEDMKLASQAFWIFDAIDYSAYVLFGNLENFEDQGASLTGENLGEAKKSELLMDLDLNKLPNVQPINSLNANLLYPIYKSIGTSINKEAAKDLLLLNELDLTKSPGIISGSHAAVLGLFFRYLEDKSIKVFLGDFGNLLSVKTTLSRPDTFYSAAGTMYYDAEEDEKQLDMQSNKSNRNTYKQRAETLTYYDEHLMVASTTPPKPQSKNSEQSQCHCLIL